MSIVAVNSVLVERPTVYGNTTSYGIAEVVAANVATPAGGSAGAAVTVTIKFSEENLPTDLNYAIQPTPSQACSIHYANKAYDSFDLVLTPLNSGATLSSGTVDVKVTWERN